MHVRFIFHLLLYYAFLMNKPLLQNKIYSQACNNGLF